MVNTVDIADTWGKGNIGQEFLIGISESPVENKISPYTSSLDSNYCLSLVILTCEKS